MEKVQFSHFDNELQPFYGYDFKNSDQLQSD